jgi:hypothetical protein
MAMIKKLILFILIAPGYCLAAEFTVNTTSDLTDLNPGDRVCEATAASGDCTLRAAVMESNSLAGADVIDLPAGTYLLTIAGQDDSAMMGDLDVTEGELTISGAGADSTFIDGNQIDRVFFVNVAQLSLQDLTIRNGLGNITSALGGGISLSGLANELRLQRVHMTLNGANAGGAVNATTNSVVTVENSLFTENTTVDLGVTNRFGSAIFCKGCDLTIKSSTFSQNHIGGKVINVDGAQLEVLNSTISGNDEGGIRTQNSNATIKFSTIVNNGAQNMSNFSSDDTHLVQIGNSVLQSDSSSDCQQGDLPTSIGYNITGDDSCSFAATGDMQNTDAMLGALMDNGGLTPTHRPEDGSILIDQIPLASCTDTLDVALTEDQRGFVRPFAANCDIGAVEKVSVVIFRNGFE